MTQPTSDPRLSPRTVLCLWVGTGLAMEKVIESGEYVAMMGGSSDDLLSVGFTLQTSGLIGPVTISSLH
jgi:hypothetical protein